MGLTGFDRKCNRLVSVSRVETPLVNQGFQILIGENNYALAA